MTSHRPRRPHHSRDVGVPTPRRRRWMSSVGALSAIVLLTAPFVAACSTDDTGAPVLRFMGPADGVDQYSAAAEKCTAAANGRYSIVYDVSAKQADDQRLQLARRIVGGDSSFDIMGLDVTWTPEFAEAGWAVPMPDDVAAHITDGTLSGPLETGTWQGTLYGAPLNTNTQLLWYRKSLMPTGPDGQPQPPTTWAQVAQLAASLKGQGKPSYMGVQAAQYEGIVVWFNSLLAAAEGSLLSEDGQSVTLGDSPAAEQALEAMKAVATAPGADPSMSQLDENQSRLAFDRGDSFAQVNYPFVYAGIKEKAEAGDATAKAVFDDMAWTVYPGIAEGKPSAATIGGLNLAVASTSRHQDLAFEAIECLRSEENQLNNALTGGLPPTLTTLYTKPSEEFVEQYPFYKEIFESLNTLDPKDLDSASQVLLPSPRRVGVAVRPTSPAYQSLSILLSARLSPPAGIDPQSLVPELEDEIRRAIDSEGLVP